MSGVDYAQYSDAEWKAYQQGQLDALRAWYTDGPLADDIRSIWSDSCEGYCPACLDSDYPRNVVIADVVRAVQVRQFGAIRRAAEVAREWDDLARFPFDLPRPSAHYAGNASAIRAAIRAAIGSPKT